MAVDVVAEVYAVAAVDPAMNAMPEAMPKAIQF